MRELLQLQQLAQALSVLFFGLYFVKTGVVVEASAALPQLNTFAEGGGSDKGLSSSSSYAYEPPIPAADDDSTTRTIRIWGSLPATYVGKVAAFGNALDEAFAANLMLPPDDPWLCEFPESLKNISSLSSSSSSSSFLEEVNDVNLPPAPYKIALFVSLNGCSAEQKARVALEIRQKVTPRLELLILYSTNPKDENNNDSSEQLLGLESLQLDPGSPWLENDLNLDGERNLGILQVPQRYATGIDVRIRVNTNSRNADPRLGMPTNEKWKLEVEVAPLLSSSGNGDYNDDAYHGSGGGSGGSGGAYRHGGNANEDDYGSMYWFRIVLFTLLIVSPCCRAGYLWHAGGGRFHWRRNDNGRIVGILYVPPISAWLSTGVMQQPKDNRAGKLTMEQFNTLPEIKYMPNVDDSGDDVGDDDIDSVDENNSSPAANEEEEVVVVDVSKSKEKQAVVKKLDDSDAGESSSSPDDTEFPSTLAQNTTDVTDAESMETAEIVARAPDTSTDGSHERTEEDLELGDASVAVKLKEKEQEAARASALESSSSAACDADNSTNNNADQNIAQDECSPAASCSQASSCSKKFKPTTSSMCSICIDDFEEGESLILLPRCQHAFHKDCILPWLTERQGCCPTCKCNVLEEDDEQEGAEEAVDDDDDSDAAETNENDRNNNVNLVEPAVVVAPPAPPSQSRTR